MGATARIADQYPSVPQFYCGTYTCLNLCDVSACSVKPVRNMLVHWKRSATSTVLTKTTTKPQLP